MSIDNYVIARFGASAAIAFGFSCLLGGCMYLQPRSEKVISGVILDERTEKPIAGAVVVLRESQWPFLMFPFATNTWEPISKALTNERGEFRFDVCVTDSDPWLEWDDRGGSRNPEWSDKETGTFARLYSLTPPDGKPERLMPLDDDVDDSMTELCKLF